MADLSIFEQYYKLAEMLIELEKEWRMRQPVLAPRFQH